MVSLSHIGLLGVVNLSHIGLLGVFWFAELTLPVRNRAGIAISECFEQFEFSNFRNWKFEDSNLIGIF